jgi:4-hydroxybenzoate polyprenyltransferase
LKLGRFDRPTGIWLLMLPGWQGLALAAAMARTWPSLRLILLFALGAALMRAAGCAYNDIVDKDLDAGVARTAARPVASGAISVRSAWIFVLACSLASLLILLSLDIHAVILGLASLVLVAAYPFMKRITWWPQAWLGLTFNWGVLMGFAAANGAPDAPLGLAPPALLLYASGVLWTVGYDTIYAVQDLEDDALAGIRSSARRLGQAAPLFVAGLYAASVLFALLAWRTAHLAVLFLPFAALLTAQLAWQALRLRLDEPSRALALFKSNPLAGLLLFAAIIAGGLSR